MSTITVISDPSQSQLTEAGVYSWPIWEKEVSTFDWYYSERETALILEGEVTVTPEGSDPVFIKAGDFVTFPSGMRCVWDITQAIRKHYNFG